MAECAVCPRPAPDANLCPGCVDTIRVELRSVGWLTEQLEITLTRQARTSDRNGPRSSETPLPYDHDASVDLESLRDGLRTWCEAIADRRGVNIDTPHTPPGYARWLLLWPSEIAAHPAAAELHGDVIALTRAARRTIDRHPDLRYLGPCDTPDCPGELYAAVHADTAVCRAELPDGTPCAAVYDIPARRAWLLEQAVDQLRTARQLANELPWIAGVTVTAKLIGMWAVRGKLTPCLPHVRDVDGSARYRVGEVIEVAREMALQRQSRVSGAA